MLASASSSNDSSDSSPSTFASASDPTFVTESTSDQDTPTREEMVAMLMVAMLEDLADRVRHDNINIRLVLTALAAAIHTDEERELARYVAAFDPTRCTRSAQNRLLQDAMRIINGK